MGRVPVAVLTVGEGPLVPGAVLVDGAVPAGRQHHGAARTRRAQRAGRRPGLSVAARTVPDRPQRNRDRHSGCRVVPRTRAAGRDRCRRHPPGPRECQRGQGRRKEGPGGRRLHGFHDPLRRLVNVPGLRRRPGSRQSRPRPGPTSRRRWWSATRRRNSNRVALLLAAALPLAIGIGLAVLTGMWIFLAFTAVSAVSVLVPVAAGRRQRRELRTAVAAAAREDRERRRRAAPSAGELSLGIASAEPDPLRGSGRHVPGLAAARAGAATGEYPAGPAGSRFPPAASSARSRDA